MRFEKCDLFINDVEKDNCISGKFTSEKPNTELVKTLSNCGWNDSSNIIQFDKKISLLYGDIIKILDQNKKVILIGKIKQKCQHNSYLFFNQNDNNRFGG